ncbi:unnamed protein product, partial [Phaeothamnion confervicola]
AGQHTLVLLQEQEGAQGIYLEFESTSLAMDGIVNFYEQKLRRIHPGKRNIQYDISDLFAFLDALGDLAALTLDPRTKQYGPHDRQWCKDHIFRHLRRQAG